MSEVNDIIEQLILVGAVEVAGLDSKTGEFMYSFTPKASEIFPEFHEHMTNHYHAAIMELWNEGYIEIRMDDEGEPLVGLNEKSTDVEALAKLGDAERALMYAILGQFDVEM